ncbi:hypothetical protein OIU77_006979 [Salix suchowensis]|uniref:Uncharacterized protein n=1 Tax=Salix suchowensis TaxID=1278906 RepID=A0ABQ9AQ46_9ROSI|nr:hypothetical protein OIU77_006979 [Salix suchowensis]
MAGFLLITHALDLALMKLDSFIFELTDPRYVKRSVKALKALKEVLPSVQALSQDTERSSFAASRFSEDFLLTPEDYLTRKWMLLYRGTWKWCIGFSLQSLNRWKRSDPTFNKLNHPVLTSYLMV